MTVAELIAALQTMPPQHEVRLADWNEGYSCPCSFSSVAIESDAAGVEFVKLGSDD